MNTRITTLFAAALLLALPLAAQQPEDGLEPQPTETEQVQPPVTPSDEYTPDEPATSVDRTSQTQQSAEDTIDDEVALEELPQTATPLPLALLLGSLTIGAGLLVRNR